MLETLDMLLPNLHGFVNLGVQSNVVIKKSQQLLWTLVVLQVPRPNHSRNLGSKVRLGLHDNGVQSLGNHQELVLWGELAKILHSERLLGRLFRPSPAGATTSSTTSGLSTGSSQGRDGRSSLLNILEVVLGVGEGGGSGSSRSGGLLSVPSSSVLSDKLGVKLERDIGMLGERVDGSTGGVNVGGERRASLDGDTRVLGLQKVAPLFSPLRKVDVQRLGSKDLSIHLRKSTVGLLGGRVTDKSETFGLSLVILHDDGRGDGSEFLEFLAEGSVRDFVVEVLDVQVGSLAHPFLKESNVVGLEFLLPLGSLLGTGHIDHLALKLKVVEVVDRGDSGFVSLIVEESESLRLAFTVLHQNSAGDFSILSEELLHFFVRGTSVQVLDVHVGEIFGVLLHSFLLGDERTNVDNKVGRTDVHVVDLGNGIISILLGLIVNESITLALSFLVNCNFAGQDVSEIGEGVVQGLVVNGLVQVLDEHISDTRLPHAWVTLGPHDTAWLVSDGDVVQRIQSKFSIARVVEVDVGISKGSASDGITANTDGSHRPHLVEKFEQMPLRSIGGKITHVQRRRLERRMSHLGE